MVNEEFCAIAKALSNPTRVRIVELLSCGELCACRLLDHLDISQPALSHHMKVLADAGLVSSRREGKWTHYTLVEGRFIDFSLCLAELSSPTADCPCHEEVRPARKGRGDLSREEL